LVIHLGGSASNKTAVQNTGIDVETILAFSPGLKFQVEPPALNIGRTAGSVLYVGPDFGQPATRLTPGGAILNLQPLSS
jgi:hypothetical protein